jgi:hypothetical protein
MRFPAGAHCAVLITIRTTRWSKSSLTDEATVLCRCGRAAFRLHRVLQLFCTPVETFYEDHLSLPVTVQRGHFSGHLCVVARIMTVSTSHSKTCSAQDNQHHHRHDPIVQPWSPLANSPFSASQSSRSILSSLSTPLSMHLLLLTATVWQVLAQALAPKATTETASTWARARARPRMVGSHRI